jgi:deoxycytidylate deaminase
VRKLYKKTTLYVVRCDSNNELQESTPCNNCLKTIIDLKIKRIVFSTKNSGFISINPIYLKIEHMTAGTKFIKNKENNENKKNKDKNDENKENKIKNKNN